MTTKPQDDRAEARGMTDAEILEASDSFHGFEDVPDRAVLQLARYIELTIAARNAAPAPGQEK